eukprot:9491978-Pyramimonas_sp.AAC.1
MCRAFLTTRNNTPRTIVESVMKRAAHATMHTTIIHRFTVRVQARLGPVRPSYQTPDGRSSVRAPAFRVVLIEQLTDRAPMQRVDPGRLQTFQSVNVRRLEGQGPNQIHEKARRNI